MNYRIVIEKKARKEARKIPQAAKIAIDQAILSLAGNPRPCGSKKLTEKEGHRIRVGNYRVLYTIDDSAMTVVVYRIKIKAESTYK